MKASEAVEALLKHAISFRDAEEIADLIERQQKVVEAARKLVNCKAGFAEHCKGCDNSDVCKALAELE